MKKQVIVFSMTIFSFLIFSCSKGNDGSGGNNPGGNTTPGPLFTAVKAMMQTNCAKSGCHVGSAPTGGHDFSNDNTIVAQKDRIKIRAVDQAGTANQMPQPPNPPLSAVDQKKITDWISAGGTIAN